MNEYLRNKYGQEFVVEKPKRKGSGVGVEGIWVAQTRPVNNSQLDFEISCRPSDLSTCTDTYLDSFFSQQEYDRLKPVMSSVGVASYSVQLIIGYEVLNNITKNTNLADVKQQYNPIYKLKVSVDRANSKDDITDKVATVVDEAYKSGISRVEIEYKVSTADGKNYQCATNYEIDTRLTSENISKCLKEV